MISDRFHDAAEAAASTVSETHVLHWPMPGDIDGVVKFASYRDWRDFFVQFELNPAVPTGIQAIFDRALKLHLLAWIDFDLMKAGELAAMTALEAALTDCYGRKAAPRRESSKKQVAGKQMRKPTLAEMLRYMVEADELTDNNIGLVRRAGGSVVGRLTDIQKPTLSDLRNIRAHGQTIGDDPQAGLVELVRDLIDYAYRSRIAEWNALPQT